MRPSDAAAAREKFLAVNATRNVEARRYHGFRSELKYFDRMKRISRGLKLLDVGCGPGLFTEFMIEQGADGSGIDIDATLVARAKTRLAARGFAARFVAARSEQLPYRDGVFDMCVANSILEHVGSWEATLREITRVLKADGLLVFYTANRLHPFQQEVNNFPFYPWIPDRLKKPILAAIMKHRPDMVNYTDLPAINWFTYTQLKNFLAPLGYVVLTRLDLVEQADLVGWKAAARPLLGLLRKVPLLRYVYYVYSRDVSVYAVKHAVA